MGERRRAAAGDRRSGGIRLTTRRVAAVLCVGVGVVAVILLTGRLWDFRATHVYGPRTTDLYDPPVLAGQPLFHECSGGFYARRGDTIA